MSKSDLKIYSKLQESRTCRSVNYNIPLPVRIKNCLEAVCNSQHRTVSEFATNDSLNDRIGLSIHKGGCFIENQHSSVTEL